MCLNSTEGNGNLFYEVHAVNYFDVKNEFKKFNVDVKMFNNQINI